MKCETCLNSRTGISENGYHCICTLSAKKAANCITDDYKHYVKSPLDIPQKPITNADRIRAMSDEELADFLCYWDNCSSTEGLGYNTEKVGDYWLCTAPGGGDINGECQTCALSWLKSPVEEVENGT